uniref:non-specific serine/threonine protein kinase n=1 Tax=Denticeps clupeoides TaxID=299321 RepID=A0AAY4A652_9TELE
THFKVLKEIPVGDRKPNESVQATQKAKLLSQLHHPNILKFYTSLLEGDCFSIGTFELFTEIFISSWQSCLQETLRCQASSWGPEVLQHQGYNSKSDTWWLDVLRMCCLEQAFKGHNLLILVIEIVQGRTPVLPERYSAHLNTLIEPQSRLSAEEALKMNYIEENIMQHALTKSCRNLHLPTLQERSVVQTTPRECMRFRKQQAADERNIECLCDCFLTDIPEDPLTAGAYYCNGDAFESCSEEEENSEEPMPTQSFGQVLPCLCSLGHFVRLGEEVFQKVYDSLKQAKQQQDREEEICETQNKLVERPYDCFECVNISLLSLGVQNS